MQPDLGLYKVNAPVSTRASLSRLSSAHPLQKQRMPKRFFTIVLVVLLTLCATALVSAQDSAPPVPTPEVAVAAELQSTPLDQGAHFRVAHFAPDASIVDVYFNGNLAIKNMKFPSV